MTSPRLTFPKLTRVFRLSFSNHHLDDDDNERIQTTKLLSLGGRFSVHLRLPPHTPLPGTTRLHQTDNCHLAELPQSTSLDLLLTAIGRLY